VGEDMAISVAVDPSDDSFVVVGYYNTSYTSIDYAWMIMKFSKSNVQLWNKSYNITSDNDRPTGVAIDKDGNITVVGYYKASSKASDYGWHIVKFNKNGDQIWNRSYNISDYNDQPSAVAIDKDGNITVVGYDNVTGTYEWNVTKLDKNGNTLWAYAVNFSSYHDQPTDVAIDNDNNIIVVGFDRISPSSRRWKAMKLDKNGTNIWNYTNDTNPGSTGTDMIRGVSIDRYNNITLVGYDNTATSSYQWRIIRIGYDNTTLWETGIDFSIREDYAKSVATDSDNNIIVVGFDNSPYVTSNNYQWRIMKFKKYCESDDDCECWQKCALPPNPTYKPYYGCYSLRTKNSCNYLDNCDKCNMNDPFCINPDDLCYNDYCWNAPKRTCEDDTALCHVLFVQCVPQTTTTI
jgi:hypothetical protein